MSGKGADKLLYLLKTRGPLTAQALAEILSMTSMGARKQLEAVAMDGLVEAVDRQEGAGVGRPSRYFSLTAEGHARFPDRHGDVIVQLLRHLRTEAGDSGVERLIAAREAEMTEAYGAVLEREQTLSGKLKALAKLRAKEGYMAEVRAVKGGFELVEHHCPICAAAEQCQGFCRSELQLFRHLLPEANVERTEHLLSQGARCVYRIVARAKDT